MGPKWVGGSLVAGGLLVGLFFCLPVASFKQPYSTVMFDRDDRLLGATIAADGQWRFPPARPVPEKFAAAVKRFEDRRFDRHPGIDPASVARAAWSNLSAGRIVSGASTLTMQVVRLCRRKPRTFVEKGIEALWALRLEAAKSKQEILALYAAHAPFGGNVVGLEAATWRYFGRRPEDLTWAEAATLAALPNSPALIHPGRNRQKLKIKRDRLLAGLAEDGTIDAITLAAAKLEAMPGVPQAIPLKALHLLARAQKERQLVKRRLATTLQRSLQERAVDVVWRHHRRLSGNGIHNLAAVVIEVDSGEVLAYVGNVPEYEHALHANHVDVVTARRSTGSLLKPLLFGAMLEAGELLPQELVADVPTRIGDFSPENFSRTYDGAVPASEALARSLNVPAVRSLRSYGVDRFYDLLGRLGMTTLDRPATDYGLALMLGGSEATLWDLVGIYAGLARSAKGQARPFFAPRFAGGAERAPWPHRPIGPGASYLTLTALLEVRRPGVENAWQSFLSGRRVAWKTGTSFGFRDAWAIGVTPQYAIGVWAGNADGEGRPGLTGHAAAAPILFELFGLVETGDWFDPPQKNLAQVELCANSGKRAGSHCPRRRLGIIPQSGLDTRACSYCREVHCDDATCRWQVHGDCEALPAITTVKRFVLPPQMEWYYHQRHADYRRLPPYREDCRAAVSSDAPPALACLYPRRNSAIFVPRELDGKRGRAIFEAAHRDSGATIFWHLDAHYLGATTDIHHLALAPAPGRHTLTLVDEHGEFLQRTFTVLAPAP